MMNPEQSSSSRMAERLATASASGIGVRRLPSGRMMPSGAGE